MTPSLNGRQRALQRYDKLTNPPVGERGIEQSPARSVDQADPVQGLPGVRADAIAGGHWAPLPPLERGPPLASLPSRRVLPLPGRRVHVELAIKRSVPKIVASLACLISDLTYSIVLNAVGGDAGSLASRTADPP